MIRSKCISSKFANEKKIKKFQWVDCFVLDLKNRISKYVFENLQWMIDDYDDFITTYSKFNNDTLYAWEVQTIFHDICDNYKNTIDQRNKNLDTSIQVGYEITYYQKKVNLANGEVKNKGDVKSFQIKKKYTDLSKFVKLLVFLDRKNLKKYKGQKIYDVIKHYQKNRNWERILKVAELFYSQMMSNVKCVEFTTGSYRVNLKGDEFIVDKSNSKFKYWFKYLNEYYPLLVNKEYHGNNPKKIQEILRSAKNNQVTIKVVKDRVDFIFTNEYEPKFKEQFKVVGIDINIKHNFCTTSDKKTFDYDRKYIQEFIGEIKTLDKIGYNNISESQKEHLNKIIGKNEWYFKKLISEVLDELEKKKVTDIVMENFDSSKFKKSLISNEEFKLSYTRLVRLLRLGNIKKWMLEQGEKRGIRIHITNPAYSSQQCPKCKHIDRDNRPTQEDFKCIECGFEDEADFVSPINLRNRFLIDVLKEKLHTMDEFARMIPKRMNKETVKKILSSFSSS